MKVVGIVNVTIAIALFILLEVGTFAGSIHVPWYFGFLLGWTAAVAGWHGIEQIREGKT